MVNPPYRFSPIENPVNIRAGDNRLTIGLRITCSPTIEFQRHLRSTQEIDWDITIVGEGAGPIGSKYWPWFVKQFRWIWTVQAIEKSNFQGGEWQSIKDGTTKPFGPYTVTGIPTLPQTVIVGPTMLASQGPFYAAFWPRPRWDTFTGSPVLDDDDQPIPSPVPGKNYVTVSTVTIKMTGIPIVGTDGVLNELAGEGAAAVAYTAPWDVGFTPFGGPQIVPPGVAHETDLLKLGALSVNLDNMRLKLKNITWKPVGAVLEQGEWKPEIGTQYSKSGGIVYILCEIVEEEEE